MDVMCDLKSKCATIPCHAEEADRLTKHLLPVHTVEVAVDKNLLEGLP